MDLVMLTYRPLTKRAARRVLAGRLRDRLRAEAGRFTRTEVDAVDRCAWLRYATAAPNLPSQPTVGSTMNVRLACFTCSFFEELLARGVERTYAIELVADAAWSIYRTWARLAAVAARLAPGTRSALAFAKNRIVNGRAKVSLRFPFNSPGYRIEDVIAEKGTAFDVVHCPVASYFRERDAADLCVASWCSLDYALAEMMHQTLVRTKTLVQGSDCCDFRVLEAPAGNVRAHAYPSSRVHLPLV